MTTGRKYSMRIIVFQVFSCKENLFVDMSIQGQLSKNELEKIHGDNQQTHTIWRSENSEPRCVKSFFLGTLAISEKVLRTAISKLSDVGMVELDKRGGRVETNQIRDKDIRQLVDSHIERFPRIESHFCRQNTDREYLCSDLTLTKMHRMFCKEQSDDRTSVSFTYYSKIFKEKNLSFHHPK